MASAEQLALSDFLKSVHQELRNTIYHLGIEDAWNNHCADAEKLSKYASAMKELATGYWKQNQVSDSAVVSRIDWTFSTCNTYFKDEIVKHRNKDIEVATKINCTISVSDLHMAQEDERLKLLDVGSCYNPFQKFNHFDVTPIDIAPASKDVYKCDFLNVNVADSLNIHNNEVHDLPKDYYNIVVFSLLLEYLPSPKQRLICCEKAYTLLKPEGLLIIITPDSNHVGTNAKYMKSWRFVLAEIGFSRVKYEKLTHIHCMAFRKSLSKEIPNRWAVLHKKEQVYSEIFIPQDFKIKSEDVTESSETEDFKAMDMDFLNEFANCDIFQ